MLPDASMLRFGSGIRRAQSPQRDSILAGSPIYLEGRVQPADFPLIQQLLWQLEDGHPPPPGIVKKGPVGVLHIVLLTILQVRILKSPSPTRKVGLAPG